ncbi:DUF397 domain-containing protein [Streptomyces sp. NPDC016845]|uniref:DUF397 domain-containing protein n=1 Tax=Streptomyces sp. NPDC016845 TaxID=3364972 RepID=UPI0037990C5A
MTDRTVPARGTLSDWRKSSYSNDEGGSCLEVLDHHPTGVPVRDSKTPEGPALLISAPHWTAFISALKCTGTWPLRRV